MEIKRTTIENKTLQPLKQPAAISEHEIQKERKHSNLVFTGQSKIISKNNEIGILLASLGDGKVMKDTVLQLFKKLHTLSGEGKQTDKIFEQVMRSLQGLVKQAHIKELPLLDGTYDFAEVQLSFGRKVHIPLLDVSALLSRVENDSSEGNINLMVTVITAYITKLSNETILISVTDRTAKERDVSVWRALAEMNMTQLSQALKQTMQEHKWSMTFLFLFVWIVAIILIRVI
ncbi:group-specific protein [Bacillus cereus]|nr:group-specific protein [Bacillus cereus]